MARTLAGDPQAVAVLARRFRTFIRDCRAADVLVVADVSGAGAVRFIAKDDVLENSDLSKLGESVAVDSGCGGGFSDEGR